MMTAYVPPSVLPQPSSGFVRCPHKSETSRTDKSNKSCGFIPGISSHLSLAFPQDIHYCIHFLQISSEIKRKNIFIEQHAIEYYYLDYTSNTTVHSPYLHSISGCFIGHVTGITLSNRSIVCVPSSLV